MYIVKTIIGYGQSIFQNIGAPVIFITEKQLIFYARLNCKVMEYVRHCLNFM